MAMFFCHCSLGDGHVQYKVTYFMLYLTVRVVRYVVLVITKKTCVSDICFD